MPAEPGRKDLPARPASDEDSILWSRVFFRRQPRRISLISGWCNVSEDDVSMANLHLFRVSNGATFIFATTQLDIPMLC